jgi:hypothetical protein
MAQRCSGRARGDGNDGRFGTATRSGRPDPGRSARAGASPDLSDGLGTGKSAAAGLSLDPTPSTGPCSPVGPPGDRSTPASGPGLGPAGRRRSGASDPPSTAGYLTKQNRLRLAVAARGGLMDARTAPQDFRRCHYGVVGVFSGLGFDPNSNGLSRTSGSKERTFCPPREWTRQRLKREMCSVSSARRTSRCIVTSPP